MRIAGLPNRWVLTTSWSCFAVFVEVLLTRAGIFHWHWAYWGWPMLPTIVVFGYGTFFFAAALVFDLGSHRKRFAAVGAIAAVDACLAIVLGVAGWL
jgi:hypothetical protein